MISLLHGEDSYRSRQKLNQIKEEFKIKDPSNMNLIVLDGENLELGDFKSQVESIGFLSDKRLVVVSDLFSNGKNQKEIVDYLSNSSLDSDVVFYEEVKLDGRLIKKLSKNMEIEEFNLLKGFALSDWVEKEIKKQGARAEKAAVEKLVLYVGSDLWQMANEINKLIAFSDKEQGTKDKVITSDDVELLVKANFNNSIFDLVDAIGNKRSKLATKLIHKFLESGESELSILGMINWQFRNLLMVKDLLSQGASQGEIIKKTGLHPFVAQKTSWQVKNFEISELKKIYGKLVGADQAIKTGQIEPDLALELLVVGLCGG